ncbi:IS1182 family transposase [Puniceicoccaceae bacterium K14]|nr:IS1182 family transposase [Puniceicoccaceae bacterium K14]
MTYIEGENREQELLLPDRLEDYVDQSNPVRFIEAFVDTLDIADCGFQRSRSNVRGRPSYDPRDLLKLYLYGYMNRTRSSRMLERACHINLEAIWLMRKLKPDFKTIAEFRRNNAKAFKGVFRKFVVLCRSMGLLGGELVAIDGTQLKAQNNPRKNLTRNRLKRLIAQADQKIEEYLKRLDDEDAREKGGRKLDRSKLKSKIASLESELEAMQALEKEMQAEGVTQISDTDPDSRSMSKNPRIAVGYNAQASADGKHGLIVAEELSNDIHDYDHLASMAKQSKENLGDPEDLDVTADKGYDKASQMKEVEQSGCRCHVPARKSKGGGSNLYSKDSFQYLKAKDAYRCPAGKHLPRRYETFKQGKVHYAYTDLGICAGCPIMSKCTKNARGRTIWRREDEEVAERVVRRMEKEPEKYARRAATIEKVFGTIKWAMECESLLMKGLSKCQGEWSLMCSCYNMKRALKLLGTKKLIEALFRSSSNSSQEEWLDKRVNCLLEGLKTNVVRVFINIDSAPKNAMSHRFMESF